MSRPAQPFLLSIALLLLLLPPVTAATLLTTLHARLDALTAHTRHIQTCASYRQTSLAAVSNSIARTRACTPPITCASLPPLLATQRHLAALVCPWRPPFFAHIHTHLSRLNARLASAIRKNARLPPPAYALKVVDPPLQTRSVLILAHGLGRTPADLEHYISLHRAQLPHTRFILPQANNHTVSAIPGPARPSWFDILSLRMDGPQATAQIIAAARNMANIAEIQHVVHGVPYSKIVIAGLSQGGALALTAYLRHPFASCISISGFLPIAHTYPAALHDGSRTSPGLLFHGDADKLVPVLAGRMTADAMLGFGRNVSYVEFEGDEHLVPDSFDVVVQKMVGLLRETFD